MDQFQFQSHLLSIQGRMHSCCFKRDRDRGDRVQVHDQVEVKVPPEKKQGPPVLPVSPVSPVPVSPVSLFLLLSAPNCQIWSETGETLGTLPVLLFLLETWTGETLGTLGTLGTLPVLLFLLLLLSSALNRKLQIFSSKLSLQIVF